ncbi:MAG: hypothetical protein EOP83_12720 [Verrucomicrobiaceae bacterium]|nr:MAG: hypothetical protein EOP83_12720 [Verrucomicrobiaceae bacterium]
MRKSFLGLAAAIVGLSVIAAPAAMAQSMGNGMSRGEMSRGETSRGQMMTRDRMDQRGERGMSRSMKRNRGMKSRSMMRGEMNRSNMRRSMMRSPMNDAMGGMIRPNGRM